MALAVSETLLLAEPALQAQTMKLAGLPGTTSPVDGYGLTRMQSCGIGGGELDVALGDGLGLVGDGLGLVGDGLGLVGDGLGLVEVGLGLADGEPVADVLLESVGLAVGVVGPAVGVVGLAVGVVGLAVGVVWLGPVLGAVVLADAAADDDMPRASVEPGVVLVGGSAVAELDATDAVGGDAHNEFAVLVAA